MKIYKITEASKYLGSNKELNEKINKAYYLKGYIEALETLTLENHE